MNTSLTVLTTDDYAVGAVALAESLRRTRPRYGFVVVLTKLVSEWCERALAKAGIATLRLEQHLERSSRALERRAASHWNNTFSKLLMFELVQYDKFVYLDSDMMVLRNLDHLFDKPHMSACVPDKLMPGRESWVQFCSGLLVVEPQPGLAAAIMQHLPAVESRMTSFSDQDLLHEHFADWPSHPELELEQGYGVFAESLDRYVRHFGYNMNFAAPDGRTIAAVHFVGARKPWTWSMPERIMRLSRHALRGEVLAVGILRDYLRLLRSAREALR